MPEVRHERRARFRRHRLGAIQTGLYLREAKASGTFARTVVALRRPELARALAAAGEVRIPDTATPEEEERILRAALGRPIDTGATFATGGDVSRFQRSSIPPKDGGGKSDYTPPAPGVSAKVGGAPATSGPSVRVTRGQNTIEVPVEGKITAARAMRGQSSRGIGEAGRTVPAAAMTVR